MARAKHTPSRWKDDVGPRLLGSGPQALIAITLVDRLAKMLRSGVKPEVITIDVERLTPGETLTIATRPPLTGRERKLTAERARLQQKLDRRAPSNKAMKKADKAVVRAERAMIKSKVDGRRHRRAQRDLQRARADRAALLEPSRRTRRMLDQRDRIDVELERERGKVMAKADKKRRPAVSRVFRW